MRTLTVALFAALQLVSAQAQSAQSTNSVVCANVYILEMFTGAASSGVSVEVSTSIDDAPFEVKGKLLWVDWGAFQACGRQVVLRFRQILRPEPPGIFGLLRGKKQSDMYPKIIPMHKSYRIDLSGRKSVYVQLGKPSGEIDDDLGKKIIAKINARRASTEFPPTGWDWLDRRELYYGKGSVCLKEKSERCP